MYNTCSAADRPTVGSMPFHHTPETCRRTLPIQQQGTLCQCSQYPLYYQWGKEKTKRNPTVRWEVPRPSPSRAGNLDGEVTPEPT